LEDDFISLVIRKEGTVKEVDQAVGLYTDKLTKSTIQFPIEKITLL
jgi:hypothetical protein